MSATRPLPLLALLLAAAAAPAAQAAPRRDNAQTATTARNLPARDSAAAGKQARHATPAPAPAERRPSDKAAAPRPTKAPAAPAAKDSPSTSPVPKDSRAAAPAPKDSRAAAPAPKDSPSPSPVSKDSSVASKKSTARPLHPPRDPLLARHPAATCALDALATVGLHQHSRARESLREFYWSDMARFFETALDLADPAPRQVADPAFLATAAVLRDLPASVRTSLTAIAAARVVDRLGERELVRVGKQLATLSSAQVASLLRADAPTLRAYVWTWLATTKAGGCHLGHLDLDFIEHAVADRSVAVEHGDDLVFRSLGDYALMARARLAALDPSRFDGFLARLTAAADLDPLVRAAAHGVLLRRGHWDTQATGLRDPSPAVRAATAAAAIEMDRDRVELALIDHAAADPADLVTELIVGALLGVYDPHNHGRPKLRGPLAASKDERLATTVARWRGRGDPLEPLPAPRRPLRLAAAPVSKDMSEQTAAQPHSELGPAAARAAATHTVVTAPAEPTSPVATPAVARAEPESSAPRRASSLPSVLDPPEDDPAGS